MSDIQLGRLAPADADRDATHVAVVPMVAAEELAPGEHVGIVYNGDFQQAGTQTTQLIGIVDPFLATKVEKGQRFFLCLYPRTVVGLRHVYEHPALDGDTAATSRAWIEALAGECDQTYGRLMEAAEIWVDCNDYTYDNSETYKRVKSEKWSEFWDHYDRVKGTKTPTTQRHSFFTCSC